MLPNPKSYAIYPTVVPADKQTEMTVVPTERAFLFFEGQEYTVKIIAVDGDDSYYDIQSHRLVTAVAHDGVLKFSYTFEGEQEYLLLLNPDAPKPVELHVYSLREDLYALMPLKGDFHGHSFRSDGKRDPAALAGHYREQGYDFFSLTDHNRYYPGGEIDETYAGVKLGITRVLGEEIHCPDSVIHIVHVGGKKSVTERYVYDRENYEAEIADYMTRVPVEIPEIYRSRYAKAMWTTDQIHKAGGLAIFPHPYWRPSGTKMHNVRDELAKILLSSGMFDAYELLGGMGQVGCNRSVALWGEARAEGVKIPVVGSSDVHGLYRSVQFPHLFTVCFAEKNENDSIIDAVRKGNTVAVEAVGAEYDREYRCYGSLRLVSYAQFLLTYYFPELQRICQGEGVAMRTYAMKQGSAELVELQVTQTKQFVDQYFGRRAPILPDESIRAFEEKWRERHLRGPETKGSSLTVNRGNRQI